MNRILQLAAAVLMLAGSALGEQSKVVKAPPPRKDGAFRPMPKGGAPKMGPGVGNPASPAARLYRATPEERERVIEKMPPPQQERVRNQLRWYDGLPKNQQQIVIGQTERYDSMSPEKRRAFLQQMQNMQRLEPDRRVAVRQVLRRLELMSQEQRAAILNSEQFKARFSPEEQKIIAELSEVMLPPM